MAYTKQTITINQVVSEESRQVVVRGAITVPEPKPDVDQIISTDKTVSIKDIKLLPDKAVVQGKLTLQIVYVAFEPDQSVHHMHGQIPFTAYVDLPGALPDMDVDVDVLVEDVKITRSAKDARKFDVIAVLEISAKVTEPREVQILTDVDDGMQAEYDIIHINDLVGRETSQVIVSDSFDNPPEKPEPKKILDVDATAAITETRIVADKVIVDGEIHLQVLYVGAVPEQSVHDIHETIKFTDYIEVPGAEPDMDVMVRAMVENCNVEIVGDPYFMADCVIKLDARVTQPREVRVVVNCGGTTMETVELNLEQLVGEDSSQVVIRENFVVPEPKPCPEKIINVSIQEIKVTETKVIKNKIITRGYVDIKIIYVSAEKDQAVHAMHQRLNFRTFVEIKGAVEGMDVDVRPMVEYINAEPENCEVNIEAVIKVRVRVTETMRREVCVDVVNGDVVCPPGEIINYTIKAGDTFFELAQRYNTTVNMIKQLNPGVDPDNLKVGQVIRIMCGNGKPKG